MHGTKTKRRARRVRPAEKFWIPVDPVLVEYMGEKCASGIAWTLLLCLFALEFEAWTKGQPLLLTSAALKKYHISRGQKRRALEELEAIGLISVVRGHGKNPHVTLNANPWQRL